MRYPCLWRVARPHATFVWRAGEGERHCMAQAPRVRRLAARLLPGQLFSYQRNVYLLLLFTLGKGFQLSIAALSINLYLVKGLHYSLGFAGAVAPIPAPGSLLASIPLGLLTDR